jgi:hypothetical protein
MEVACDSGDKRSCEIVKAADQDAARANGDDVSEDTPSDE